jgi:hypothetical protein
LKRPNGFLNAYSIEDFARKIKRKRQFGRSRVDGNVVLKWIITE